MRRSFHLPDDALSTTLRPLLEHDYKNQWRKLSVTRLWKQLPLFRSAVSFVDLGQDIRHFLQTSFTTFLNSWDVKFLKACRPHLGFDPIMWLPMTTKERSKCIRWRLGWLPGGRPRGCLCGNGNTTKKHLISCLRTWASWLVTKSRSRAVAFCPESAPTYSSTIGCPPTSLETDMAYCFCCTR